MVRDFMAAAFNKLLCKGFILFALFIVYINTGWTQEPAWNRVVTICADTYFIPHDGTPSGGGGTWSVLQGSGTFSSGTQETNVSNISPEENWYHWNQGSHNYYIKVIRVIAPVYNLTAPDTFCEADMELPLLLSG